MTCVIRPEEQQMKKPWSSIPNKSNVEGWNQEKTLPHKKIIIKRMRVKIKIKSKLEGIKKFKFEGIKKFKFED